MVVPYKPGDLVLAKMKGFSPWPGRIEDPSLSTTKRPKKNAQWVFFFGTGDYAWIELDQVKPYYDNREKFAKSCKTGGLKRALEAIEDYIEKNPDALRPIDIPKVAVQQSEEPGSPGEGTPKITPGRKSTSDGASVKRKASADPSASGSGVKKPRMAKSLGARASDDGDHSSRSPRAVDRAQSAHSGQPSKVVHSKIYVNHVESPARRNIADAIIERPAPQPKREPSPIDVKTVSEALREKNIRASDLKFGFLGIGMMGSGILKNLLNSGHYVTVWSRTEDACKPFLDAGAHPAMTPSDVVSTSDITFSCITDPTAVRQIVFGNCGVLEEMQNGKGYVELSTIDPTTSADIAEAIAMKGGRYLEAQMTGSRQQARDGHLVIITAGDRSLFEDCATCFSAMGVKSFHIDGIGNACKMNLYIQTLMGIQTVALAEVMTMVEQTGLLQRDFLEILQATDVPSKVMVQKANAIIQGQIPNPSHTTSNMKKVLQLVLGVADSVEQSLPVTALAHELYKHTMRHGYGHQDDSAVYTRIKY